MQRGIVQPPEAWVEQKAERESSCSWASTYMIVIIMFNTIVCACMCVCIYVYLKKNSIAIKHSISFVLLIQCWLNESRGTSYTESNKITGLSTD